MKPEQDAAGVGHCAVFPLGVILLPGGLLQLRIFEPRYLRMVSECLRLQVPFVVAAILSGREAGDVAVPAASGTLAEIVDWEQLDDGLLGLLCEGRQKVSIGELSADQDGLLRGSVEPLPAEPPAALPDDLAWMAELLEKLLRQLGPPYDRLLRATPGAGDVADRLVELLPLPLAQKQALFEATGPLERLRRLAGLIDPEGSGARPGRAGG
jgi:Lon protease-like protein